MNLNEKTYNAVLQEANDFFQAQGISIIGEGYKEIASNPALFESYVDQLTLGASADNAAAMAQLMQNSNANILRESSITGIQPVASLSMPVIRKLWPKFALKEALKTEPVKTPRFVVAYTKPYMMKGDKKVYIPQGLRPGDDDDYAVGNDNFFSPEGLMRKELTRGHFRELAAGAAVQVNFKYQDGVSGDTDEHVVVGATPSTIKVQPLDELFIEAYAVTSTTPVAELAANKEYVEHSYKFLGGAKVGDNYVNDGLGVVNAETATNNEPHYELVSAVKLGKRLNVYGGQVYALPGGGQLVVQFDGAHQTATFAAVGASVVLTTHAAVSSEYNEESWSVGFDIARQDIDIPTGQHINAPLPIEALQDYKALYQIDGTKETVDLMTNFFAQKLDVEVLNFLRDSWANQPGNEAFADYDGAEKFGLVFDCKPAAGFAGSPKAWREELKPMIDHLAQRIKNATLLQSGMFTIVGNPIDVQVLANVDWQFRGGQGGNMDGVEVDYSVGTYVGANAYKVIASTNVPTGAMYLVFTPSSETQMTYKYYPYSFATELAYVDPNRSRVPSIMMTKRHTMHEFMPAIGVIAIKNNDGKSYFADYTSWKAVA